VLEPCAEIAAELRHPLAACTIRDLLDNISVPHPLVAVVGVPGSGATEVAAAIADATLARLIRGPAAAISADRVRSVEQVLQTVAAWRQPLAAEGWEDDSHGAVADYWLDALPALAADHVAEQDWSAFTAGYEQLVGDVVPPHVAIFLRLSPAEIRSRLAFRSSAAAVHSDVFADLPTATPAEVEAVAAGLERLQARLERRLRCPSERCPRAPKAVITIDADDLAAAAAEATAAVEAML
jgi:broad-specificity NMP kinase